MRPDGDASIDIGVLRGKSRQFCRIWHHGEPGDDSVPATRAAQGTPLNYGPLLNGPLVAAS
ncbi:hypothetical protein BDS110ZK4_55930 [Bradyrhizobium diazoefficiens]|uniref:Uncharacterized protein n=1 Tax=Bradyrhizobium diazoefficiens TaxID=1355477 RepID=A0A809YWT8_9BRAD|nr:hypothetical protein H12S4_00940 [Bradyrhizobium diazoefficiens]BCE17412.1 hypothetical protein XF1B_00930 [Bradyrhizobium diazoefficiens]BCE43745.1 hypothetical protein XF4B_00940 [Bradyrhizobium diazoefficiens]BCE61295.1 hypothetical protein XF6B_00940 [Bradyrhizobium diazoefficiens]BCE96073.1 hypothetical protein XF11B_00940 [Bradyrhizobium diazoefficiens]